MLTFRFCFPGQHIPENLKQISNYDIWKHDRNTVYHQLGIRLIKRLHVEDITDDSRYQDYVTRGIAIKKYCDRQEVITLNRSWEGIWQGRRCLFVNSFVNGGFTIDEKYDFLVGYVQLSNLKWKFSLRGRKESCGSFCAKYGGGGHDGAAGFVVDSLEQIMKEITPL